MTRIRHPAPVVFASVVCDLLHVGHIHFLRQAKLLGLAEADNAKLVVGVLADKVVESYKRRPIIPEMERLQMVRSLELVDAVFLQTTLEPDHDFLDGVDIIAHGDDWPNDFPGADYMRHIGKKAINVPYYHEQSTTRIIQEILRRETCESLPTRKTR